MEEEPKKPDWLKDTNETVTTSLGGLSFQKALLEKSVLAAKESGIENEDILRQTAFNIYYGQLNLKSLDRIKNNIVFWFWITAGWILVAIAGVLGIGAVSSFF